jgi:amino acid transporter
VAAGRDDPQGGGPPPRAGFWATVRAVLWSFIGIRKRSGYQRDAESLDPRAVVVAGLLGGLLFVLMLLAIVRWVLSASQQGGVQ